MPDDLKIASPEKSVSDHGRPKGFMWSLVVG